MTQDPEVDEVHGDEPGYAQAVDELTSILAELETDDVDVDVLGERVARAAELIAVCRERIDAARFQVERIVAGLATPTTMGTSGAGAGPGVGRGRGGGTTGTVAADVASGTAPANTAAADISADTAADPSSSPAPARGAAEDDETLLAAYDEPDVDGAGA